MIRADLPCSAPKEHVTSARPIESILLNPRRVGGVDATGRRCTRNDAAGGGEACAETVEVLVLNRTRQAMPQVAVQILSERDLVSSVETAAKGSARFRS